MTGLFNRHCEKCNKLILDGRPLGVTFCKECHKDKGRRRRQNQAEQSFVDFAEAQGWETTKRGWPDFVCFENNKAFCVEVKPRSKALKREQRRIMEWLESYQIDCKRWDPIRGFTDWDVESNDLRAMEE